MIELPLEYYAYTALLNCLTCSALVVLVWVRQRHAMPARLFCALTCLIAVWSLFYFLWLRTTTNAQLADWLERTCMVPVVWMPSLFVHFAASLTNRVLPKYLLSGNYLLSFLISLTVYTPLFSPGVSAHLVFPYWLLPGPVFTVHVIHMLVSVGYGLLLIGQGAAAAEASSRQKLWLTFLAFAVGFPSGFTNYFMWYRLPIPPILNAFVSVYFAVIAYAIVKHQLMDIRVVIRKSLVYSLLVACITGIYLVMVLIMEKWFQGFFGYRSIVATAVIGFVIAIGFNPLRSWLQTLVDRRLFTGTPAELAAQREQLLGEVKKTDQMKAVATLAAGLAHEIKNPLASIKTFTEYLQTHHADPAFREKFTKIVGGEVERINLIVHQLLEFAKPVPPKLKPLDVSSLLDETLDFLSNELTQHHVALERRYAAGGLVLADPQQLKQVFLNLLLNSLQAMNGQGQLDIATSVQGSELEIAIRDNGSGIAPADLPRIFDPFFTTKATGTGLGLAVVQQIIQEHGGHVAATSHLGQGTTFNVYLPIAV